MDDYYRQRIDAAESARENLRAKRMAALEAALRDVLDFERDVIDDDGVAILRQAGAVVADLRQVW